MSKKKLRSYRKETKINACRESKESKEVETKLEATKENELIWQRGN